MNSINYEVALKYAREEIRDINKLLVEAVGKELDEYGTFLMFCSNKKMVQRLIDKAKKEQK
jgi:hypothetical protein